MRNHREPSADPVLRLLVLTGLLIVPWFLAGPGGAFSDWLLRAGLDVLDGVLAARLYRLPGIGRTGRRFWVAVIVSAACNVFGDSLQAALVATRHTSGPAGMVPGAIVAAGLLVIVIAMLLHPVGGVGRQRMRVWLDTATVLTAAAVFLWYFLLAGQLGDGQVADRVGAAVRAAAMLLVMFALIKLIFSASAPFHLAAGIVSALGMGGIAIGTSLPAMVTGDAHADIICLVQVTSCLLIPISLRLQEVLARRHPGRWASAGRQGFSRLPYAAVAGTQLLLVAALPAIDPGRRIWGVAAGVLIITGLVLGRQQAAFHDNERLVEELSASREWFSALVQHASDLTVVTNDDGTIQYASPAAERFLGALVGTSAGETLISRIHPGDQAMMRALVAGLASASAETELRVFRAGDTHRWLHVIATDLRGNPNVRGIVWNGRDITEARRLQDELRHQATHDTLTGLANLLLLRQQLREAAPSAPIGILLIDLDGFKDVNDRHGHHAGDEVLVTVSRRISAVIGPAGTVARLGGDEFAVLLPGSGAACAQMLADLITTGAGEPIPISGGQVTVGASVGMAFGTAADADRLLRDADDAMYRIKESRRRVARTEVRLGPRG